MAISVFDMFKIGIGPSSSHTMGPMRAAHRFLLGLEEKGCLDKAARIKIDLYGSLALTGIGHGTDKALLLGLEGDLPDTVDPDSIETRLVKIRAENKLSLMGKFPVGFTQKSDIEFFRRKSLPFHPNGMHFFAWDGSGNLLHDRVYYSIGGGFVVNEETAAQDKLKKDTTQVPYPFKSGNDLLKMAADNNLRFSDLMRANERCWRTDSEIDQGLRNIWQTMQGCIDRGCRMEGSLPGPLKVKRRAPDLYKRLTQMPEEALRDPLNVLDWVNLYALAVNEENACGARIVTAPTNGAAGIMPACMRYFDRFSSKSGEQGIFEFLLTSGAIGILYAENASISGAEVGCQGEVGVACSMAAGGLTAALGGTMKQVEQAAEIGMEHNLGLTCDPIGGLVQIPCIERNAMGAVKAINASRIALRGDGNHHVSLDSVIKTMQQTGADMMTKYKETSRGGLAVNVSEC
jgi:L-serine dehydratase